VKEKQPKNAGGGKRWRWGMLLLLAVFSTPARAAEPAPTAAAGDPLLELLAASPSGEVVRFAPGGRPEAPLALSIAARVPTPPARLIALLHDPATYQRAVPAFVRAETEKRAGAARLIAWELEVPLWNLEGRLWLKPRENGVRLELESGDLVPGAFDFAVSPCGNESCLVLSGGANLKNANFVTRRLARDRPAEPAMTVTAMYVLLRALALEAGRTAAAPPAARWPSARLGAPPARTLTAAPSFLAKVTELALPASAAFAHVASRSDGRLHHVVVALPVSLPQTTIAPRLLQPTRWRALPGWKQIEPHPAPPPLAAVWEVDAGFPFVDFDARWAILSGSPFRAESRGGDWQGAVIAIDLATAPDGTLFGFSTHPRLDHVGYFPRKLIEAEPLLEHGLALGLAFVNARSLVEAVKLPTAPPPAALPPPPSRSK
jgi:hypothetical protein